MSGKNFQQISELAYQHSGIVLIDRKQDMIYGRLARRLRKLGIANFDLYLQQLDENWEAEGTSFLNAITTNKTAFFRENHHFEHLAKTIIPNLKIKYKTSKRIRVWSAAASTGEEPYSIAMVFKEAFPGKAWDIKILATDIDSDVLAKAQAGVYTNERVEGIEAARLRKWFKKYDAEHYQANDSLKSILQFKQLNLLEPWPIRGQFDVVFCRNVIIYFDLKTQKTLFQNIHQHMVDDACLYIGHSETLLNVSEQFKSYGLTIYKRLQS